jgi:hypothetical protein
VRAGNGKHASRREGEKSQQSRSDAQAWNPKKRRPVFPHKFPTFFTTSLQARFPKMTGAEYQSWLSASIRKTRNFWHFKPLIHKPLIQRVVKFGRFKNQKSKMVARIMIARNTPPRNRTCRWCCESLRFLP